MAGSTLTRWWVFNTVGLLGVIVQLAVLQACVAGIGLPYLAATAIAVEAAIVHNFVWHEHWTWRGRDHARPLPMRLAGFHMANGVVSLAGNLAIMRVLVGAGHVHPLAANFIAIATCSVVNFLVSDRVVYQQR
jgi:putative flippase GtrA